MELYHDLKRNAPIIIYTYLHARQCPKRRAQRRLRLPPELFGCSVWLFVVFGLRFRSFVWSLVVFFRSLFFLWLCRCVTICSMIVSTAQGQFEFPLELLDFQPVAPQNLVLFVNLGDFL